MAIRQQLIQQHNSIPVLERYQIIDCIKAIPNDELAYRNKALIAFMYLTGCRVEECCRYTRYVWDYNLQKVRRVKADSLKAKQVDWNKKEGRIIVHNLRTLKNRELHYRNIPIMINSLEEPMVRYLIAYLLKLDDESLLFQISRVRAYQILSSVGLFNHWMRHVRASHLCTDYNLNSHELRQFFGWTDDRPGSVYVHLSTKNLEDKMRMRR